MRVNNVFVRALSAVLVAVLLNGSVVAAFAHVARVHGAGSLDVTRVLA